MAGPSLNFLIGQSYAQAAPLPGTSVPISTVEPEYTPTTTTSKPSLNFLVGQNQTYALAPYESKTDVITAFQNGEITAEYAVDVLIVKFNMSRPDATNTVFSATSTFQDLNDWVEGAEEQFKENLIDPDYTGPVPSPPPSPDPSTPENNEIIPTFDPSARGLQIIPKESNIPMMALGAFILFVVGKNLNSVVRA